MIYLRGVLTEGVACVFAEKVVEELADGVFEGSLPKDVARIVPDGVIEGACEGLFPKNVGEVMGVSLLRNNQSSRLATNLSLSPWFSLPIIAKMVSYHYRVSARDVHVTFRLFGILSARYISKPYILPLRNLYTVMMSPKSPVPT